MLEHISGPVYGSVGAMSGIVAQLTVPELPDDFKTWPITAMLVFVLLACLSVIVWQIYTAGKIAVNTALSVVESAKAIQAMNEKQAGETTAIMELAKDCRDTARATSELVAVIKARPCMR